MAKQQAAAPSDRTLYGLLLALRAGDEAAWGPLYDYLAERGNGAAEEVRRRDELTREVRFDAAWDHRDRPGSGQHGVEAWFFVRGREGAVTLCVYTGWALSLGAKATFPRDPPIAHEPIAAAFTRHSPVPLGQDDDTHEACEALGSRACWFESRSYSQADELFRLLVREGSDGLWREMEAHYREAFRATGEGE